MQKESEMKILITGGAGFTGSNIAIKLKQHLESAEITVLDNLYRKGSEMTLPRLEKHGIKFIKGDVRNSDDLASAGKTDFMIECSAEPSVLSGADGDCSYLIETNLTGALNCAEYCRRNQAGMIFISTSRVYPIKYLCECRIKESAKRFDFSENQELPGVSPEGISEKFPMDSARSLYGGTKYAAEIMLDEYRNSFKLPFIINRCGVLAGPWQFGKTDQGIAAFWIASHIFKKPLKYIGFGGHGKQVRDMLHIDDLFKLLMMQIKEPAKYSDGVFNAGGGLKGSVSLQELTEICGEISGNRLSPGSDPVTRYADIPVYITDSSKLKAHSGWSPEKSVKDIIADIHDWIQECPEAQAFFK